MNHVVKKNQSGFTIIELTIAMGFVSAILVAIALTIIQIGGIYNRGVTLKQVNQAGRAVISELQDGISASSPFSVETASDATDTTLLEQDWGGAFCMGSYSYIWNNGDYIDTAMSSGNYANLNIYSDVNYNGKVLEKMIPHFIKIYDPSRSYCVITEGKKINGIKLADATDLLAVGQNNLVIHDLIISTNNDTSSSVTNQQLYDITIILGTNNRDALLTQDGVLSCKPPSALDSDPTYCSVVQFHLVARAGSSN